jgi:hypothetical protein
MKEYIGMEPNGVISMKIGFFKNLQEMNMIVKYILTYIHVQTHTCARAFHKTQIPFTQVNMKHVK